MEVLQNLFLQHLLFLPLLLVAKNYSKEIANSLFCSYSLFSKRREVLSPYLSTIFSRTRAHHRDFMFFAVTSVTPHHIIISILHNYVLFLRLHAHT